MASIVTTGHVLLFGLVWGGVYALITAGLNLIYGTMKILNVAHGEFLMLGAYSAFWLFTSWHVHPLLAMLIAGPAVMLLGVGLHRAIVEPIASRAGSVDSLEKATLVAFFAILLVIQNTALLLWSADYRVISVLQESVSVGGLSIGLNRLVVFAVAMLLAFAMHLIIQKTDVGKAIRAVSEDRVTAQLVGINPQRIGLVGFGMGSLLAGVAGVLVSMIYVITPTMGVMFTVKAFTVMIVAGLGNQLGTLLGGLMLGLVEAAGGLAVGEAYRDVIGYALLIGVILWRSYFSPRPRGAV